MIAHNLYIMGMSIAPHEADAPPVVDANTVLTDAVALQRFEPVTPDGAQVVKISRSMKPTEPFPRSTLDALKFTAAEAVMERLGFCASK